MAESALDTFAVNSGNSAAGAANTVAVVNDGTANRQIVTLGASDGTTTMVDGTPANPLNAIARQQDTFTGPTAMTITLASLANSTAGVGRQSTIITGNTARSAIIACKITVGTTPVANSLIYVYLVRGDTSIGDDGIGLSDAALTVVNAPLLGTILCSAATSNVAYYGIFDTKPLGSLGPDFGVAIVNSTNVALNSTAGNHLVDYTTMK